MGRSTQGARPLRAYGWRETGVVVASLAYFGLRPVFEARYAVLSDSSALVHPSLLLMLKLLLAVLLLSPAAFFMGGTLPMHSAWLVRHGDDWVDYLRMLFTVGAIVGSLAAGVVPLEWLGLWRAMQWLTGLYLAAALAPLLAVTTADTAGRWWTALAAAPLLGFLLLLSALDSARLPVVRTDPARRAESLIELREGGSAIVAVVRRGEHLGIKVDNNYTFGSTRGHELRQH